LLAVAVSCSLATSGCSIKKFAGNQIGDALSKTRTTYASDDDIALVGDALPFALKLVESLLEQSPDHPGLLGTACEGFTTYSYIYVQSEAETLSDSDLSKAREARARSRRLYRRALRYCLHGLDTAYSGIIDGIETDASSALSLVQGRDVALLYWTAAALGLAISVSKDDAAMLARIPGTTVRCTSSRSSWPPHGRGVLITNSSSGTTGALWNCRAAIVPVSSSPTQRRCRSGDKIEPSSEPPSNMHSRSIRMNSPRFDWPISWRSEKRPGYCPDSTT
jgi:hypothetical protein